MKIKNKISIITVCLNSERTIEQTIISVKNQSYQNYEHIFIDGGSEDATVKIIKKHFNSKIKLFLFKKKGIYNAFNKGIDIAKGRIIGFLNSDDFFYNSDTLKKISHSFNDKTVMVAYGNILLVNQNNTRKIVRTWTNSAKTIFDIQRGWCPPHPSFYCRKLCYIKFGKYNTKYGNSNDIDLMIRFLYLKKLKAKYIPNFLVKMRTGGVSTKNIFNIIIQNYQNYKIIRDNMSGFKFIKYFFYKFLFKIKQIN
jgi:glycosyltransferase involved in cell wall biosynthesis